MKLNSFSDYFIIIMDNNNDINFSSLFFSGQEKKTNIRFVAFDIKTNQK